MKIFAIKKVECNILGLRSTCRRKEHCSAKKCILKYLEKFTGTRLYRKKLRQNKFEESRPAFLKKDSCIGLFF